MCVCVCVCVCACVCVCCQCFLPNAKLTYKHVILKIVENLVSNVQVSPYSCISVCFAFTCFLLITVFDLLESLRPG